MTSLRSLLKDCFRRSRSPFRRRKTELFVLGREDLVEKARTILTSASEPSGAVNTTYYPGYSSKEVLQASKGVKIPLVVILSDINTDSDISEEFVDEISSLDFVLWLTGGWASEKSISDATEGVVANVNIEQKKRELRLRNNILKKSLRKGASYARWSVDNPTTLLDSVNQLVQDGHIKMDAVRKKIDCPFTFTDATTGVEISDPLELSEEDFIIAVMGATGAGKSTFIKNATGCNIKIGDELESCTSEIHIIRVMDANSKIYIIDTPGFNDTNRSDLEIFILISEWLRLRFINQVYLSGLIYLHRISDNRMGGTTLKNLKIFEDICGEECFHKVTLATTMWNDVTDGDDFSLGENRETQLRNDYFKLMLDRDARLQRLSCSSNPDVPDSKSPKQLLADIIKDARDMRPLSLQKELVAYQKVLAHTNAGRKMYSKLDDVLQAHKAALAQLGRDIRVEKSEPVRKILLAEHQRLNEDLICTIADMQTMKLSLPARIMQIVTNFIRKEQP